MGFLVLIMFLGMFMLALAGVYGGIWLFAIITYKLAHKNVKKIHKSASKNANVIFDIDRKGKTLQEIQLERRQMTKILGGI